jgi:hypothetical protein
MISDEQRHLEHACVRRVVDYESVVYDLRSRQSLKRNAFFSSSANTLNLLYPGLATLLACSCRKCPGSVESKHLLFLDLWALKLPHIFHHVRAACSDCALATAQEAHGSSGLGKFEVWVQP